MLKNGLPYPKLPIGINVGHYEEAPAPLLLNRNHIPDSPLLQRGAHLFRVIRFMDWQKTNLLLLNGQPRNQPIRTDGDRPKPTDDWDWNGGPWFDLMTGIPTFAGVPYEVCVEFANAAHAAPWICIPHAAEDAFIEQMIEDVIATATYTPIFEYSNEVWNPQFGQHFHCREMADAHLPLDTASPPIPSHLRWQAHITERMAKIVDGRAYVVICAQAFAPNVAHDLLRTGVGDVIDALAIAPYFGQGIHDDFVITSSSTAMEFVPWLESFIDTTLKASVEAHKDLCDQFSTNTHTIALWGYEGGQQLVARLTDDDDLESQRELFAHLNRLAQMRNMNTRMVNTWYNAGGDLMCLYNLYSRYGDHYWGYLELDGNDLIHPRKYEALVNTMHNVAYG